MTTIDHINRRMGSGTMQLLGEGIKKSWSMRHENRSQRYTTEWNELAVARCDIRCTDSRFGISGI
jgi:DNA polymerase V